MSIEQKIQQILAESQNKELEEAWEGERFKEGDIVKIVSDKRADYGRLLGTKQKIVAKGMLRRGHYGHSRQISEPTYITKDGVILHHSDLEKVNEETAIADPLNQPELEPNNARNNVDRQDLEVGEKDENEHTENAAPAEPSNLEPLAFKEDIDALVSGEELTEEFKQKAATIFEAAVLTRVKQEIARLDEAYQVQLDERVEEIKEGLVEKVDGYLDYVVEQWMKDNEIALESGMKSEILEGFVSGLKGLFEQHYIEVPEEKFDVLGSMQEQIAGLTTKLDEQVETNIELRNKLAYAQAEAVVRDLAEGLTDTDKDKFFTLVEELEFDGLGSFTKKAQTIRESYFTKKAPIQEAKSYVVTDEPVVLAEETKRKQQVDPQMANYLNVLNNLIK